MASIEHHVQDRPGFDEPTKLQIVVSPYYKAIADNMVAGAKAEIEAAGATWDLIEMPGALEIPTAIGISERMSNFDGYVALGCVIRGDTDHYDHVVEQTAKGIKDVGVNTGVPTIFGVLTCDTLEQAIHRAGAKMGNAGRSAMMTAVEMANLMQEL